MPIMTWFRFENRNLLPNEFISQKVRAVVVVVATNSTNAVVVKIDRRRKSMFCPWWQWWCVYMCMRVCSRLVVMWPPSHKPWEPKPQNDEPWYIRCLLSTYCTTSERKAVVNVGWLLFLLPLHASWFVDVHVDYYSLAVFTESSFRLDLKVAKSRTLKWKPLSRSRLVSSWARKDQETT